MKGFVGTMSAGLLSSALAVTSRLPRITHRDFGGIVGMASLASAVTGRGLRIVRFLSACDLN